MTRPGRAGHLDGRAEAVNPPAGVDNLTAPEVAAILRVKVATLRTWRYLGTGPAYIAGRRPLYPRADLDAYIASRRAS